jgi:hypothetical protein
MVGHLDAMEAEWLRKLTVMREAISKLNLPKSGLPEIPLVSISEDEFLFDSSSANVTDFLSDESSDEEDAPHVTVLPTADSLLTISYNREWLETRIKSLVLQNPSHQADDLINQIVAVLVSDSTGQICWSTERTKQSLNRHR